MNKTKDKYDEIVASLAKLPGPCGPILAVRLLEFYKKDIDTKERLLKKIQYNYKDGGVIMETFVVI